ncbi:MAG: iron uptake porin [Scytolyngbya sp. HA4215-MV1]|jgi:hypothetical protein|nr:iron uptake porin [Scytolyngbya sp. HA4215-MV1]
MSKVFWQVFGVNLAILSHGLLAQVALATVPRSGQTISSVPSPPNLAVPPPIFEQAPSHPQKPIAQVAEIPVMGAALSETDPISDSGMDQVTSLSQLSDVQPTDWAFEALRSLVEKYGCLVGYPDSTFQGNHALSRNEFAAGLSACLDRLNERIAVDLKEPFLTQAEIEILKKLQEEFSAELSTLRSRISTVDERTAELEKNQFSTTTKLSGEVITYLGDGFGDAAGDANQPTVSYRVRLNLDTSFTGKDRLRTRLQAANFRLFNAGNPTIDNATGGFGAPQPYASTFPTAFSDEARFLPSPASEGENDSSFRLNFLGYDFPIGDRLNLHISAGVTDPTFLGADPISPFSDFATGSISNFANSNPVYYPMGNRAGAGFDFKVADWLTVAAGYIGQDVTGLGNPASPTATSGILNGGYLAFSQLTVYAGKLTAGFLYMNSYTPQFGIDTLAGSNAAKVSTGNFNLARTAGVVNADDRVSANHYGFIVNYKVNPRLQIGGWLGLANARVLGVLGDGIATGNKGDVQVLNYAVTLAMPDLFKQGNLGGFVFGMQPRVVDTSNDRVAQAIGLPNGQREDRDVGFHLEAFYRFQVNEFISITPGVLWLTAPNHDSRNPDAVIGVIRTSFTF